MEIKEEQRLTVLDLTFIFFFIFKDCQNFKFR